MKDVEFSTIQENKYHSPLYKLNTSFCCLLIPFHSPISHPIFLSSFPPLFPSHPPSSSPHRRVRSRGHSGESRCRRGKPNSCDLHLSSFWSVGSVLRSIWGILGKIDCFHYRSHGSWGVDWVEKNLYRDYKLISPVKIRTMGVILFISGAGLTKYFLFLPSIPIHI